MNKKKAITQIRNAYKSHINWIFNVQTFHLNISDNNEMDNLSISKCEFGKWYKENIENLSYLKSFQELEPLHKKAHRIYQSIEKLHKKQEQKCKGIMKIFFGCDQLKHENMIKAYNKHLNKTSKKLLAELKDIELNILSMSNEKFNEIRLLSNNNETQNT